MGRGSHSTDSKRYYDWLFYAYQDHMAALVLSEDNRLYSMAAFHCQQCIEKALKSYLLFKNRKLLDGHNLTWLCKQAAMMDNSFAKWLEKSTALNRYYIETRYPADILLEIDKGEIDDILDAASEMLDFICEQIKFDFNSYHKRGGKKSR
jgi:HEPN domain-containing protein